MSAKDQEFMQEQQRVNQVVRQVHQRMEQFQDQVGQVKSDIVDIRKNFWDEVTVNFEDPDDVIETYFAIKQQAEVMSEKERQHGNAQHQLRILTRLEKSPYFGRFDFLEDGEKHVEPVYVGIGSFRDEDDNFLVYDWRAPISSLYYDYSPGPAAYKTPGGTISGMMDLKRQYIIRDGRIVSLFDTGVTIGDELLQEVLGKQSDTQMRSIVATIQKEQNQIIRDEQSRVLIVQGAAGSGKTSAALQRIAYLLYRYRETLRAEQIMLFSPNPMFNSYVSTVLPELGEENMQQTTFQEYLEFRLGKTFQLEDPFMQMEYVYTAMNEPGYADRMESIRYKASRGFMDLIDDYAEYLGHVGMMFRAIRFRGETLVSADRIRDEFYSLDTSWSIPNRMKRVVEWLLKDLKEKARLEREKPWVEDEIQLLDKEDYVRAHQELRRNQRYTEETFDDFDREQELLSRVVVNKAFKKIYRRVKNLQFIDMPGIYKQLFSTLRSDSDFMNGKGTPATWELICQQTLDRLSNRHLAYEDVTPFLYLQERIEGFQTNTTVRHVFIDEAQDYSPFEFAFIRRLFPHSKMTVLGDVNQLIYAHATDIGDTAGRADNSECAEWDEGGTRAAPVNRADFGALSSIYTADQIKTFELKRSYRSTRQIVQFTRQLISDGESIEPFNRNGNLPTVTMASNEANLVSNIAARISALRADGHQTIAIICKTAHESKIAHQALHGLVSVRLITQETVSYEPGILVIPAYLAKGVEFDAVILFNGSQERYGRENERKLLYTACTRAMHALHIYYIGELSPFIAGAASDTYTSETI